MRANNFLEAPVQVTFISHRCRCSHGSCQSKKNHATCYCAGGVSLSNSSPASQKLFQKVRRAKKQSRWLLSWIPWLTRKATKDWTLVAMILCV